MEIVRCPKCECTICPSCEGKGFNWTQNPLPEDEAEREHCKDNCRKCGGKGWLVAHR